MLKDGRPITDCGDGHFDAELIDSLSKREQIIVLCWIDKYLCGTHSKSNRYINYGLKHILEKDTGIYVTNNQFKDAMMISGYKPIKSSENEINWEYWLDKHSTALRTDKDGQRTITEENIKQFLLRYPQYA